MRIMICIAMYLGLGVSGCAVIDDEVSEPSDDPVARMAPIDDTVMDGQEDLSSTLPADVVEELMAIGCPINCVGICACQFRFCLRQGNDDGICDTEQDLCIAACYE